MNGKELNLVINVPHMNKTINLKCNQLDLVGKLHIDLNIKNSYLFYKSRKLLNNDKINDYHLSNHSQLTLLNWNSRYGKEKIMEMNMNRTK